MPALPLLATRWKLIFATASWIVGRGRDAYGRLTPKERSELAALVRGTRGRPDRMPKQDRDRVVKLVSKALGRS